MPSSRSEFDPKAALEGAGLLMVIALGFVMVFSPVCHILWGEDNDPPS